MKTMPAGEFKLRCLRVLDEIKRHRTPVVITKKGRPVAKLVPLDIPTTNVFGCMTGTARIVGDVEAAACVRAGSAASHKNSSRQTDRSRARRAPRRANQGGVRS